MSMLRDHEHAQFALMAAQSDAPMLARMGINELTDLAYEVRDVQETLYVQDTMEAFEDV